MTQAPTSKPGARRHVPSPAAFRFKLLGEVSVARGGEPIPPPPHRTQGLLAALLLRPYPQRRERLVGLLFPDVLERKGRQRLSHLLWLLRQWLPELTLETSSQEICLPPETRWLDVEAFWQVALEDNLDQWREALALYRGDLLEGVYDDWLLEERETLYLQYIRLSHRACDELLRRGHFKEALPLAERLVQREPYDEQALRTLMQAYRAVGRRGAALAAYERFVSAAADELGAEPEPATQALAQAIRFVAARTHSAAGLGNPGIPALEDDSPQALLYHAQEALARGERATAEECLQRLRVHPNCCTEDICLLEVDLALFYEEYSRAARLLEACDSQHGPVLARIAKLALERRQAAAACDAATTALVLAHEAGDCQAELEAVLVLTQAQRRLGQGVQAARSAEQALSLARACDSPAHITRALITKGHSQFRQGRYAQALSLYHEARSLAHEQGLRRSLAEALHWIAWIQSYQGALLDALTTGQEALSIWRDLEVPGHEASTLQNLAYTLAQLGRTAESLRALEQAFQLCEQLGEPVRAAVNEYHLADTLLYHDDAQAPHATAVIREALTVFQTYDQTGWEAAAWDTLGRALWLSEHYAEALDAFQEAYKGYEHCGELGFLPELLARQGLAYLGLGERVQALRATRQALVTLAQGEVSDEAIPEIYYAHARALTANDEPVQAQTYLQRAYENLLAVAAHLEDEAARQAYFHHNPVTRRLMKEVYARGIAHAPKSGVISRQLPALRDRRPVQVRWTVDAGPADVALKQARGAIALRRARLSRLLDEAEAQGATPTAAHLAEALGVSKRTIQRDMAASRHP